MASILYGTADLCCDLNINYIANYITENVIETGTDYLVMSFKNGEGETLSSVIVYDSGKILGEDMKSDSFAYYTFKQIAQSIKKLGFDTKFDNFCVFTVKMPSVRNIMASAKLNCVLDLHHIASQSYNTIYNPSKFHGMTIRIRKPRSTANIFTSGKISCFGTDSEALAKVAIRKYARIVQKLGYPVRLSSFKVCNIICTANLGYKPNFEQFFYDNIKHVFYNPEIFHGLEYKTNDNITVTIMRSGKINMTNIRSLQQMDTAYRKLVQKTIHRGT